MILVGLLVVGLMALSANGDVHDQYVGCYGDNATRAMEGSSISSSQMAIKTCYNRCYNSTEYTYLGLQYGSYCFCGDSYDRYGSREVCTMKCAGNASEMCGGNWASSIYSVCPSGYFGHACDMTCHCLAHSNYGLRCYRNGTCPAGCQPGWTGYGCHLDIDECVSNNNGGCEQNCINTQGGYLCSCEPGFALNADGMQCEDINECAVNKGGCAQNCINTQGSYLCSCEPGFTPNADGIHCDDIDECATNNDGCEQNCINTQGSYLCSCDSGFTLNADNKRCDDIDECATNKGGCAQNCVNTPGSYSCACDSGFTLNADGIHCDDFNECATNNGGCEQNCINTQGSYFCSCDSGFTLNADGMHCDEINECASSPCLNGGTCVDGNNGYSCDCHVLYTGSNCELVTACQITSEDQRHSCGVASQTEQECINAGCCWDGTHANMMCFRKIIKQCSAAQSKRVQCPGVFTTEGECKAVSCCWDNKPEPGMASCYLPDQ